MKTNKDKDEVLLLSAQAINAMRCVMESVPVDVINQLVDACIDAYIEDTGLTAAPKLKAAVLAATGKTPEEIYGWDEVHGLLPKHYFVVWAYREKENKARAMYDEHDSSWNYSNTIIMGRHPLQWFSKSSSAFDDNYVSRILWWTEISDDEAKLVHGIVGKE